MAISFEICVQNYCLKLGLERHTAAANLIVLAAQRFQHTSTHHDGT